MESSFVMQYCEHFVIYAFLATAGRLNQALHGKKAAGRVCLFASFKRRQQGKRKILYKILLQMNQFAARIVLDSGDYSVAARVMGQGLRDGRDIAGCG